MRERKSRVIAGTRHAARCENTKPDYTLSADFKWGFLCGIIVAAVAAEFCWALAVSL